MIAAGLDLATIGTLVIGIGGLLGAFVAALKYRGESTTNVVTQQSTLLQDMKALNDELVEATRRLRSQVADLEREVKTLRSTVKELTAEVETLRAGHA